MRFVVTVQLGCIISDMLSLIPTTIFSFIAVLFCPILLILYLLNVPLPSGIADGKKLFVVEMVLRVTGEYGGDIVEILLGPQWRNSYLRFIMSTAFYLPIPRPTNIEYSWTTLGGVPVRLIRPSSLTTKNAIVYIHGGGWSTMKPHFYDHFLAYFVKRLGCTVLGVEYRLSPEHPFPAARDDCESVLRALDKSKLEELGIEKLAVMGDSAGGNLSAVITRRLREEKRIKCQVLIYPVTSVFSFSSSSYREYFSSCGGTALLNPFSMARWILFYLGVDATHENVNKVISSQHLPRGENKILDDLLREEQTTTKMKTDSKLCNAFLKGLHPDVSPLLAPDLQHLPPTMVLTAGIDVLRDEGRLYARRLEEAGVQVDAKHYPSAYHGIMNMPFSGVRRVMIRDIVDFLDKNL